MHRVRLRVVAALAVGVLAVGSGSASAALPATPDDTWGTDNKVDTVLRVGNTIYLGGRVVRAAVGRKEAAEDAGRHPRAVDVRLAGLAPAGLVPTD